MIFEKKALNGFKKNVNGSVRKISKSNLEGNLTFHPSIVERGTLHIFLKVIFQYQNGESIINLKSYHYLYLINHKCNSFSLVFVFMFVCFMSALYISICICISNGQVLLRSEQSDIFQSPSKYLLFLLLINWKKQNIWFLSIFKTCVAQIKFEETAQQYLASGRQMARFYKKDRIGEFYNYFRWHNDMISKHELFRNSIAVSLFDWLKIPWMGCSDSLVIFYGPKGPVLGPKWPILHPFDFSSFQLPWADLVKCIFCFPRWTNLRYFLNISLPPI